MKQILILVLYGSRQRALQHGLSSIVLRKKCLLWAVKQVFPLYKCFQNTENKSQPGIFKFETFIDQISLHLELSLKSFATFRHIRIE